MCKPSQTVLVNRGLVPGRDPCRHCGGLHYGSGYACPYLCGVCYRDIRADVDPACARCSCVVGGKEEG